MPPMKLPGIRGLAGPQRLRVAVNGDCGYYGLAWRSGHLENRKRNNRKSLLFDAYSSTSWDRV